MRIYERLLELDDENAAVSFISLFKDCLARLGRFPCYGPESAFRTSDDNVLRKISLGHYVLFYEVLECGCEVRLHAIFHQREDYEGWLR